MNSNPSLKEAIAVLLIILGVVFVGDVINRSPIPEDLKSYAIVAGAAVFGWVAMHFAKKTIY